LQACGYSIEEQAALFHSVSPLFANKPLFIVCNKTDMCDPDTLTGAKLEALNSMSEVPARTLLH
jgi:nucleolar GTP-binding protein